MRRFCCFPRAPWRRGSRSPRCPDGPDTRAPRSPTSAAFRSASRSATNAGGYLAATVARRLRDEGRTLDAPLRPATEVARRAGHGAAVLLKIYAHCIDGRADAANKRITNALGTQDARRREGDDDSEQGS